MSYRAGTHMGGYGKTLPLRASLVRAIEASPHPVRTKTREWTPREQLAGYVKWLDAKEGMSRARIAAWLDHLGADDGFVYRVLVDGTYAKAPMMEPPAHPRIALANERLCFALELERMP